MIQRYDVDRLYPHPNAPLIVERDNDGDLVLFTDHDREVRRLRAMVLRAHASGPIPKLNTAYIKWGARKFPDRNPNARKEWAHVRVANLLHHWAAKIEREETP